MTIENIKQLGLLIFQNPSMFQLIIETKSSMQKTLIDQLTNSELLDVQKNKVNQSVIDKMVAISAKNLSQIGKSNENAYCIAMAAGTILKELFEDQSFATSEKLLVIANRISI